MLERMQVIDSSTVKGGLKEMTSADLGKIYSKKY